MEISEGPSVEEWAALFQRAQDAVDSDDSTEAAHLELLFSYCDVLTLRYGEVACLLCIRADFTSDVQEKKQLLYRAYSLADSANDHEQAFEAAHSIVSMFIDIGDLEEAERWLRASKEHLGRLHGADFRENHLKGVFQDHREKSNELSRAVARMRRDREKRLS